MSLLLLQLFNGLSLSSILLLIAIGLAITFGLMNVMNMAHGEFIMIGAYMAYLVQKWFQPICPLLLSDGISSFHLVLPLSSPLPSAGCSRLCSSASCTADR